MTRTKILFLHYRRNADGGEETVVNHIVNEYTNSAEYDLKTIFYSSSNKFEEAYNLLSYYFGIWRFLALSRYIIFGSYKHIHVSNYFPLLNPVFLAGFRLFGAQVVVHFHNHKLTCPIGTHWNGRDTCFDCTVRERGHFIFDNNCKDSRFLNAFFYINYSIDSFVFRHLNEALTPIVLTKWYQRFIREKRGIEGKVLYNKVAHNIRLFRTSQPQEPYFIYVGRNHSSKGYDEFLNCVKTFPEIQFVSVGPNPINTFHNLKEHGWVSREETWEILSRSSCLVAPYKGLETFGMTVYESLALGIPVISSDIYSIREVFANRLGIYIYSKESSVETCIRNHLDEILSLDRRALINNFDSFERVNNSRFLANLWKV